MTHSLQIRQGDVFLQRVRHIPPGTRKVRTDGVLASGESTGHTHALADLDAGEAYEIGGKLFLSVTSDGGVSILHQEHGPVAVPKGDYEVRIQREYTPEAIRSVID